MSKRSLCRPCSSSLSTRTWQPLPPEWPRPKRRQLRNRKKLRQGGLRSTNANGSMRVCLPGETRRWRRDACHVAAPCTCRGSSGSPCGCSSTGMTMFLARANMKARRNVIKSPIRTKMSALCIVLVGHVYPGKPKHAKWHRCVACGACGRVGTCVYGGMGSECGTGPRPRQSAPEGVHASMEVCAHML
jgi:hypothetical protein